MEELYSEYQCHPCNPWSRSWDLLPQAVSIGLIFISSNREVPNPNFQIPGKSQLVNSKSCRTTDFTDHADLEELYSEYQCHPCNPWSRSLGFGGWDLGFTAAGSVHGRK